MIELKKQKVNEMLKTNGEFWSHIIWSTRHHFTSPPQTPPPSHTEQRWYNKTPDEDSSSSNDSIMDDEEDEEEEDEDEELNIEDNEPIPTTTTTTTTKKSKKLTNGRKRRGNLPKNVTAILKQWLIDHCKHPYPTEEEKRGLRIKTNLTLNQISNWFINARRRILPFIINSPASSNSTLTTTTTTTKKSSASARRKRIDSLSTTGKLIISNLLVRTMKLTFFV